MIESSHIMCLSCAFGCTGNLLTAATRSPAKTWTSRGFAGPAWSVQNRRGYPPKQSRTSHRPGTAPRVQNQPLHRDEVILDVLSNVSIFDHWYFLLHLRFILGTGHRSSRLLSFATTVQLWNCHEFKDIQGMVQSKSVSCCQARYSLFVEDADLFTCCGLGNLRVWKWYETSQKRHHWQERCELGGWMFAQVDCKGFESAQTITFTWITCLKLLVWVL